MTALHTPEPRRKRGRPPKNKTRQQIVKAEEAAPKHSAQEWCATITGAFRKTVEAYLETGRLLIEAKRDLGHGRWEQMVRNDLPFEPRTAHRLMAIASHPVISDRTHVSDLPPTWGTLYALSRVPAELLRKKIESGDVHPRMERSEAAALQSPTTKRSSKSSKAGVSPAEEPKNDAEIRLHLQHVQLIEQAWVKVKAEAASGDEGLYRAALEHLATVVTQALRATE